MRSAASRFRRQSKTRHASRGEVTNGIRRRTVYGMSARRTTEPSAKLLREIAIMVKAAGVADLADRLACACQRAAPKKTPGVIQSKRIYETAAGGASLREELLEIVQGNAR